MFSIGEEATDELLQLPETGMGFQLVEASVFGERKRLLVLNAVNCIDLSAIEFVSGDDPADILRNGLRIVRLINEAIRETMITAPALHSFELLESRIGPLQSVSSTSAKSSPKIALPSSLVKHVVLPSHRIFHRFSAYSPDRRVDPLTGSFLPGTYALPESEIPFVPTGFTAVGRFALPNTLPASFHYQIQAPSGTSVHFGTVAPAFGQAGGGVEAFFQKAVVNSQVPPVLLPKLDDE